MTMRPSRDPHSKGTSASSQRAASGQDGRSDGVYRADAMAEELTVATGPLPPQLAISTFGEPASTTAWPTRRMLSWADLVALLTEFDEREDKDGRGWSPTIYADGKRRSTRSVLEISCAVCDIDGSAQIDWSLITRRLEPFAWVAHSTFNFSADAFKVRIVVPFVEPVPPHEWPRLWPRLNEAVFGGLGDPSTKDAGRFYYLPACPVGSVRFREHHDGAALDARCLLPARTSPAPPSKASRRREDDIVAVALRGVEEGHRNRVLFAAAASLIGRGTRLDVVETTVHAANAHCRPPLRRDEVDRIIASAAKYPSNDVRLGRPRQHQRGLSPQADRLIATLALADGPLMPTPLAEILRVNVKAVNMMLLRLAKRGVVERVEAGWRLRSGADAPADNVVPLHRALALGG